MLLAAATVPLPAHAQPSCEAVGGQLVVLERGQIRATIPLPQEEVLAGRTCGFDAWTDAVDGRVVWLTQDRHEAAVAHVADLDGRELAQARLPHWPYHGITWTGERFAYATMDPDGEGISLVWVEPDGAFTIRPVAYGWFVGLHGGVGWFLDTGSRTVTLVGFADDEVRQRSLDEAGVPASHGFLLANGAWAVFRQGGAYDAVAWDGSARRPNIVDPAPTHGRLPEVLLDDDRVLSTRYTGAAGGLHLWVDTVDLRTGQRAEEGPLPGALVAARGDLWILAVPEGAMPAQWPESGHDARAAAGGMLLAVALLGMATWRRHAS